MTEHEKGSSRASAVASRWIDVLAYAAIACATLFVFAYWFADFVVAVLEQPAWAHRSLGALVLLLAQPWSPLHRTRVFGLRHFWAFPPLWFAALIGGVIALWIGTLFPEAFTALGVDDTETRAAICATGITASLAAVGYVVSFFSNRTAAPATTTQTDTTLATADPLEKLKSYEGIKKWIESGDDPLADDYMDLFGHARIARRMAGRLIAERNEAQMLVGALGSGKTSIRKLVQRELKHRATEHRLRLVAIELWHYTTSDAAVKAILNALIGEVAKDVGTSGLRGLPDAYTEVIGAMGTPGSIVSRLLQPSTDPHELLAEIDRIAVAINLHYVVWVEDLERFALSHEGDSAGEKLRVRERLAPLTALIHALDQCQSLVAVTATTSLHAHFDREKFTRYVEEMPTLDGVMVAQVLSTYRDGSRAAFSHDIDPTSEADRRGLDLMLKDAQLLSTGFRHGSGMSITGGLLRLCATPRLLKHALLKCQRVWSDLHGEIAFDDLLVMSALFAAWPGGFAFVREHTRLAMQRFEQPLIAGDDSRPRATIVWDHKVKNFTNNNEQESELLGCITTWVFGGQRPQGFHLDAYWQVFLTMPDVAEHKRDQPVLRAIFAKENDQLVDCLMSEDGARTVTYFHGFDAVRSALNTERLKLLLPQLISRLLHARHPYGTSRVPGLVTLGHLWRWNAELRGDVALKLLCEAATRLIAADLWLARELESHLVIDDQILPPKHQRLVRKHIQEQLRAQLTGQPAALSGALEHAWRDTLRAICFGTNSESQPYGAGDFPGWPALAPTVIQAAREATTAPTMLIQLAAIVADAKPMSDNTTRYEFNEARAQDLFVDALGVLRMYEPHDPAQWAHEPMVQALIVEAKARLASQAVETES